MDQVIVKGRFRSGGSIQLQAEPGEASHPPPEFPIDGARWIQVAAEGEFKGHPAGDFTFDAKAFSEIIANFRAHPSFVADEATGLGVGDVVAYDFSHASEEPASTIGVQGAPAQAWAMDLQTRPGEFVLELWALTRYLEPARSFVQQGKYKWTSVAVWPHAVDPHTGADVGWYLSSIAFTNDPFIQGMQPIAAHNDRRVVVLNKQFLFDEIKVFVLGMPETATMEEVVAELAKLRAASAPGAVPPPGVDVDGLLHRLKNLLNLPVLANAAETFAEVDKLMGAIVAAPPTTIQPMDPVVAPSGLNAPRGPKRSHMHTLLMKLGRLVGIEVPPDADETQTAVLADRIHNAFKLEKDEGTSVKAGLTALLKALGVEDADGGVTRVTEMMEASKTLADFMPQLAELQGAALQNEEEEEDEDIAATMAARGLGDEMKPVLLAFRRGGVAISADMKPKAFSAALLGRKAARSAYLKQFPAPETPITPHYLHQDLATSPAQTLLSRIKPNGQGSVSLMSAASPQAPRGGGGQGAVDLSEYDGGNLVEQAQNYLLAQPGGEKLAGDYDKLHRNAVLLARRCRATA